MRRGVAFQAAEIRLADSSVRQIEEQTELA